jgi:hypothetical protein
VREYRRCVPATVAIRNVPLIPRQSHFFLAWAAFRLATTAFAPLMAEASDFPAFSIELATSDHWRCNIPDEAFLVWPLADFGCHGIFSSTSRYQPLTVRKTATRKVTDPGSSPQITEVDHLSTAYMTNVKDVRAKTRAILSSRITSLAAKLDAAGNVPAPKD